MKTLYLAGVAAAAFAAAASLPRLVEGEHHSSILSAILFDPDPRPVDRLQVGSQTEIATQE